MHKRHLVAGVLALALAAVSFAASSQVVVKPPPVNNQNYVKPFPPVKITSNL